MIILYGFTILISLVLLLKLSRRKRKKQKRTVESTQRLMKKLYSDSEAMDLACDFANRKYRLFFLVLFGASLLAAMLEISNLNSHYIEEGGMIKRNGYGEGNRELWVNEYRKDTGQKEKIKINVSEIGYTDNQLSKLSDQFCDSMSDIIFDSNDNEDHVTKDLKLKSRYESYPFEFRWSTDKPLAISSTGKLNGQYVKEKYGDEGVLVTIGLVMKYREYTCDSEIIVRAMPDSYDKKWSFSELTQHVIEREDESSICEEYLVLPKKVGKVPVEFSEVRQSKGFKIFIFGICIGLLVFFYLDEELKEKAKKRDEEMIRDYPRIINKYALYYGAGLSSRLIWEKLCSDYQKHIEKGGRKKYVYEEMLSVWKMMNEGVGEVACYEEFGRRCQLPQYRLFVSIIEQSVKKGKGDMQLMLEKEALEAFDNRLGKAKVLGEKAGTKLLLPMLIMLSIVLFIILIPAFMSFSI